MVAIKSARVYVNGKRVRVITAHPPKRVRSRVNLRGLPKGRYTIRVVVTTTLGQRIVNKRRYRTCVPKARKTNLSASAPAILYAAGRDAQQYLYFCRTLAARWQ